MEKSSAITADTKVFHEAMTWCYRTNVVGEKQMENEGKLW